MWVCLSHVLILYLHEFSSNGNSVGAGHVNRGFKNIPNNFPTTTLLLYKVFRSFSAKGAIETEKEENKMF